MNKLKLTKTYKKYPEYKDSGVEWLGKIPKEWDVFKARNFILEIEPGIWGDDPKEDIYDLKCLRVADFNFEKLTYSSVETIRNTPAISRKKILRKNDILIEKSGGGEKQPVGRAIIFDGNEKMTCANFIDIVRLRKNVLPRFFTYQLATAYSSRLNLKSIKQNTGIQNLDISSYFNEVYPIPAIDLQKKIVKFLDEKTKLIDEIIEKKKKLIELLKEKRTAIINHAVTKGLDPNAELVDSGIDWIGKIPKGWEVRKMKFLGETIIGLTFSPEDVVSEGGTLVLRSSNIQKDKIVLNNNLYVSKLIPEKLRTRVGDILICSRNGSRNLVGKNAIIDRDSAGVSFGAFMTILRSRNEKFISWFLKSNLFMSQLSTTLTTTINQLTTHYLNNIMIAVPREGEQMEISLYLTQRIKTYDKLMNQVERSILRFQEFKISLISNVVTGKVIV